MSNARTLIEKLIALPSVNPMGGEPDGDSFESRVTEFLSKRFADFGLAFRRDEVEPGRENIIAWLPAESESAPIVLWEAHQDTVPVEGMTVEPFVAVERAGRIYGRGACDVKGPMAAMLAALEQLAADRSNAATVVFAASVNEEFGGTGARRIASTWSEATSFPFHRDPDAVIVAEPTCLHVVAAHKGTVRWRLRAAGVAAHSSTPQLGENAIYRMAKAVSALEHYASDIAPALHTHPELGGPTLSVGRIQGGVSVNIVPEDCWIEIDRRLVPGEEPESAWRHVADYLEQAGCEVVCDEPYLASRPLPDDRNRDVVAKVVSASARHGRACETQTAAYCSDAARLSHWPTIVFGPGDIAQAHTCDEWIDAEQLDLAEQIFLTIGREWPAL